MRKEQAATGLKAARHDAAVLPAREKKKYIIINQHLTQFMQEYANGELNARGASPTYNALQLNSTVFSL